MNFIESPSERINELAERVCSGVYTDAELAELEKIVAEDADSRQYYLDYCQLHSEIELLVTADRATQRVRELTSNIAPEVGIDPTGDTTAAAEILPRKRSALLTHRLGVSLTVATALLGVIIGASAIIVIEFGSNDDNIVAQPPKQRGETPQLSAGRLVRTVGAVWEEVKLPSNRPAGSTRAPHSSRIQAGKNVMPGDRFHLASGIAEIKFANGTEVTLAGPAEFEVQAGKQIWLSNGQLVAIAELERSKGFVVETPTARIADLGTEFAVTVAADGKTLVHVLTGEVTLASRVLETATPLKLTKGKTAVASIGASDVPEYVELSSEFDTTIAYMRRYAVRSEAHEAALAKLPYQPVADDLAAGLVPDSSLRISRPTSNLTDGQATDRLGQGNDGRVFADAGDPWVLTFDLAQSTENTQGSAALFLIHDIRVFSYNTDARVFQDYDVEVSADGDAWETIASHIRNGRRGKEFNLPAHQRPDYYHDFSVTRLAHRDAATMTGPVRYVRFRFYGVAEQGAVETFARRPGEMHSSLYEIDVIGKPIHQTEEPKGIAPPMKAGTPDQTISTRPSTDAKRAPLRSRAA